MLTTFLLKLVVKDDDYSSNKSRQNIGYLAGIVGTIINLILFSIKLIIGLSLSSVAVLADAFNNLADSASSIITIVGFKLSSRPPDKEHPYGHRRIEYISALLIAFMVIIVGLQFIKSSITKIINPEPVIFQKIPFIILVVSIFLKIWLSIFNGKLSKKISSAALKATSLDALGDVFTSSVVALSLLTSLFTKKPIDGYVGTIISIIIIYGGFSLVKETISPLIGETPDRQLMDKISSKLLTYKYIIGVHDLVLHNYGPGKTMGTIHAEFLSDIDVVTIHNIIDKAEREIGKELDIDLLIHMDPVFLETDEIIEAKKQVDSIIKNYDIVRSVHDFRITDEDGKKKLIFDILVDASELDRLTTKEDIKKEILNDLNKTFPQYKIMIEVDSEY